MTPHQIDRKMDTQKLLNVPLYPHGVHEPLDVEDEGERRDQVQPEEKAPLVVLLGDAEAGQFEAEPEEEDDVHGVEHVVVLLVAQAVPQEVQNCQYGFTGEIAYADFKGRQKIQVVVLKAEPLRSGAMEGASSTLKGARNISDTLQNNDMKFLL